MNRNAQEQHGASRDRPPHALKAPYPEFVLHYQLKLNPSRADESPGFEALLRWRRPGYRLVMPGASVHVHAEDSGMIIPINEWVLREACRQGAGVETDGLPCLQLVRAVSTFRWGA